MYNYCIVIYKYKTNDILKLCEISLKNSIAKEGIEMDYKKVVRESIYLFKTPNSHYLYDLLTNSIVAITSETYKDIFYYLTKQREDLSIESVKELEALNSEGYCNEVTIKKLIHPMTEYLPFILGRNMRKITLQITQMCNLRCSYCPYTTSIGQRSHSNKVMSLETAKKALVFLRDHSVDSSDVSVGFYGGEPLLEMNNLKLLVNLANDILKGKKITFSITTNGTVIDDQFLNFIYKNKDQFSILISLDGNEETHNANRVFKNSNKGSFETVISRLKLITEEYSDMVEKFMINMVLDPSLGFEDYKVVFQEYPFLKRFRIMWSIVDDTFKNKSKSTEKFIAEYEYNYFLAFLKTANSIDISGLGNLEVEFQSNIKKYIDQFYKRDYIPLESTPSGPCVPGEMRLFVDVDGNLYPCERVSETSNVMRIGNIQNGLDMKKVEYLLNFSRLTSELCLRCPAFSHCTQCPRVIDDGTTLNVEKKKKACNDTFMAFEEKLRSLALWNEIKTLYRDQKDVKIL